MIGDKLRREWEQASVTDRYHAAMFVALFGLPGLALAVAVIALIVDMIA